MAPAWSLTLEEDDHGGLRIVAEKGGQRCALSGVCGDETELAAEIRRLQQELDRLAGQGRERMAQLREAEQAADPAQIWQEMEALPDEEEMVAYFNALSKTIRKRVAEHVLTRVSAFKGMAPRFAGRYNSDVNLLE